jgi:electron transport complex protein RnfE
MAQDWTLVVAADYTGLLLAILPPGAFIITGLMIAAKNRIDTQIAQANQTGLDIQTGNKRVRVTGEIA